MEPESLMLLFACYGCLAFAWHMACALKWSVGFSWKKPYHLVEKESSARAKSKKTSTRAWDQLDNIFVTEAGTAHMHECRGVGFADQNSIREFPFCKLCKGWLKRQV